MTVKIEEMDGLKMGTAWFKVSISGDGSGVFERSKRVRDILKKVLEPIGVRVNGVAGKEKEYFFIVDCLFSKKDRVREAIVDIVESQGAKIF